MNYQKELDKLLDTLTKEGRVLARQLDAYANNGGYASHGHAICANCGKPTQVPFEPKGDRPVYCSECFAAMRR